MSRRRLNVDVSEEEALELQRLLPHGFRQAIFSVIVAQLLENLRTNPEDTIVYVLAKRLTLNDLLRSKGKKCPNCNGTGIVKLEDDHEHVEGS